MQGAIAEDEGGFDAAAPHPSPSPRVRGRKYYALFDRSDQ